MLSHRVIDPIGRVGLGLITLKNVGKKIVILCRFIVLPFTSRFVDKLWQYCENNCGPDLLMSETGRVGQKIEHDTCEIFAKS